MVEIGNKVAKIYEDHKSDTFTVSEGNTVTMPADADHLHFQK